MSSEEYFVWYNDLKMSFCVLIVHVLTSVISRDLDELNPHMLAWSTGRELQYKPEKFVNKLYQEHSV